LAEAVVINKNINRRLCWYRIYTVSTIRCITVYIRYQQRRRFWFDRW